MFCSARVGAAFGHAEQRGGDRTGWGEALHVLPHQHLSEERRLIRVFAPDSQWPRTAVELGRGRGRVWKPLLQNVHTFFTYSTTGPV